MSAEGSARTETWLWLANIIGYGGLRAEEILTAYPNPEVLVRQRGQVDFSQLFTPAQLEVLHATQPEDFAARVRECEKLGVGILCYDSPQYPILLRNIPTSPAVLYYKGDIRVAGAQLLFAMVGTRRPSAYGVEAARALAEPLSAAGVVLVSGLATGLDSEAHRAAIKAGTPTLACIAFGHDTCYPAANRTLKNLIEQQGLVVSEYPPGTQPQRQYFLQRNRLIAGVSHGLCVAEARATSGTMHTVGCALEYGRDVFSVPGSIFSPLCEGTNQLLRDGAVPAVCAGDILKWYGWQPLEETGPAPWQKKSAAKQKESQRLPQAQKAAEDFWKAQDGAQTQGRPREEVLLFAQREQAEQAEQTAMSAPPMLSESANRKTAQETAEAASGRARAQAQTLRQESAGKGEPEETQARCTVSGRALSSFSQNAQAVYYALTARPQDVATLAQKTRLAPHLVMAALTELELGGAAAQQAGRQFLLAL